MEKIINHEEALLLAQTKQEESNLARCYLELKQQNKGQSELLYQLKELLENGGALDWALKIDLLLTKYRGENDEKI